MYKLIPALLVAVVLAGCTGQTRDNPHRDTSLVGIDLEPYNYRHGDSGQEVAELFNTGGIKEARQDYTGNSLGLRPNAFYTIEIAENPLKPTVLSTVGYIRKLEEDRGNLFIYEIYDGAWLQIAYVGENGATYRYDSGKEQFLGRFEVEEAIRHLFHVSDGYGYDTVLQDRSIVNAHDPDVNSAEPRARGVYHRTHKSAPAVIFSRAYRTGEVQRLADRYSSERANERYAEEATRLHNDRTGGVGDDEDYGGLHYKDGNPVDENGHPLRPGSVK
ncbi:MAG: hypothetical protein KDB82_11665 [Planctomycetes bacterium]|nr:hypothetical protein [Planctomycetota bacterium]